MNYSKGITWFDDCKIPFVDDKLKNHIEKYGNGYGNNGTSIFNTAKQTKIYGDTKGRYPSNLLVSDDMLNDGSVSQGQKNPRTQKSSRRYGENNFTNGGLFTPEGLITPTYSDSRYYDIDLWFNNLINNI